MWSLGRFRRFGDAPRGVSTLGGRRSSGVDLKEGACRSARPRWWWGGISSGVVRRGGGSGRGSRRSLLDLPLGLGGAWTAAPGQGAQVKLRQLLAPRGVLRFDRVPELREQHQAAVQLLLQILRRLLRLREQGGLCGVQLDDLRDQRLELLALGLDV